MERESVRTQRSLNEEKNYAKFGKTAPKKLGWHHDWDNRLLMASSLVSNWDIAFGSDSIVSLASFSMSSKFWSWALSDSTSTSSLPCSASRVKSRLSLSVFWFNAVWYSSSITADQNERGEKVWLKNRSDILSCEAYLRIRLPQAQAFPGCPSPLPRGREQAPPPHWLSPDCEQRREESHLDGQIWRAKKIGINLRV